MININLNITTTEAKEMLECSLIVLATENITGAAQTLHEAIVHQLVRTLPPFEVDEAYQFTEMLTHEMKYSFEGTLLKSSFQSFAEFICDKK